MGDREQARRACQAGAGSGYEAANELASEEEQAGTGTLVTARKFGTTSRPTPWGCASSVIRGPVVGRCPVSPLVR